MKNLSGSVPSKISFFILFFLTFGVSSFCQSDFREGYIVTLNKDTIHGLVDYSIFSNDFKICKFKGNDEITTYNAKDIQGFGFKNDKYMSSGIKDGMFVEQLLQGSYHNLYKDENSFYIDKKGANKIYHLTKKDSVYYDVAGKKFLKNDRKWQGILKVIVNDCPSLEVSNDLKFQEGRLVSLFEKYEDCRGGNVVNFKKNKPLFSSSFGILAGPSIANINIDDSGLRYENVTFGSSVFQVGGYFAISSPRFSENLSLEPEVHYIKTKATYQQVVERSSFSSIYDTEIDMSAVSIPILLKYRILKSSFKFYVLAGLALEFNKGNKLFSKETQVYESQNLKFENIYSEFVNYMPNRSLGPIAGFNLEKRVGTFDIGLSIRAQKIFPNGPRTYIFNQSRLNLLFYVGI